VRTVRELYVTPPGDEERQGPQQQPGSENTRQPVYAVRLSRRWLIEKSFGWLKQTGPLCQVKLRGLDKVDWLFVFSCAAHNLLCLPPLLRLTPAPSNSAT